jgi:hypothetical protein
MVKRNVVLGLVVVALMAIAPSAYAQNTSSVFSPTVDEGERGFEYRFTLVPDDDSGEADWRQRAHYQQAINGDLRWRVILQSRKSDDSDFDFDYARAELLWQLTPDGNRWQSGLRFDARYRDGGRPEEVGVNWTNQFKIDDFWRARFILIGISEFGDDVDDGIALETRARISRKGVGPVRVGVELFSNYGLIDDMGSFDEQEHELGPIAIFPVSDKWEASTGLLFGISDAAQDAQLRFMLVRDFD